MANLPDFSNIQAPPMIKPWVQIIEQPAPKALRFRYECEGRSAGSIPGENSTPENRTYPTIQLNGYRGDAMVYVSCVTKDPPYRPHPHNLVGREGCREGVCKVKIPTETMCLSFQNLGIQCVKKKDVEKALRLREAKHMDPFKTGFSHCNQPTSIDLNAVRLCFHVLLKDQHGIYRRSLDPVVTQPIFDKKATSDLRIVKLSHCVCYADGGTTEIILLCEKVAKEDIEVRFFEEKDDLLLWEAVGDFQPAQVHKQTAIWFRPPPYQNVQIAESVKVFIQLRRPSDGCTSEPYDFEYIPVVHTGPGGKRARTHFHHDVRRQFQSKMPYLNIPTDTIKIEPKEYSKSPSPFGGQVYVGVEKLSLGYPQSSSASPNYTPSHLDQPLNPSLPPFNNFLSPSMNWNIASNPPINQQNDLQSNTMLLNLPSTSTYVPPSNNINNNLPSNILLNLDNQQMQTDTGDNFFDVNNMSGILQNVSLTDADNMTNSWTRVANAELDNLFPADISSGINKR